MQSRLLCCALLLGSSFLAWAAEPEPASPADPAPAPAGTAPAAATEEAATTGSADATAPDAADGIAEAAAPAAQTAAAGPPIVVTDREAELASLVPRLAGADELQWLEVDGRKVFALLRRPRDNPPRGALLVVPAPQAWIDERELTHSLRTVPLGGGFVTLALQPPLGPPTDETAVGESATTEPVAAEAAANPDEEADAADEADETPKAGAADAATIAEADADADAGQAPVHEAFCPRLAAALAMLEREQPPLIAIVAEGASVSAVIGCHPDGLPPSVRAVAAVGAWQGDFEKLDVPTIEFVPDLDRSAVQAADGRSARPREKDGPPHRRVDLIGVDRRLVGAGEDVAKRVRGWLARLPAPRREVAAAP